VEGGVGKVDCKEGGHPGEDQRPAAAVGLHRLLLLRLFLLLVSVYIFVNIRIVDDISFLVT
jgi:hypothetical protein